MRFIVDFYRYVILTAIAVMIIGLVYLTLLLASGDFNADVPAWVFVGGSGLIALFVMSLGITATFISIHDRHVELVEAINKLRDQVPTSRGSGDE